ncbi:hypothetical protein ACE5IS_11760 [Leptospira wolffii]|uniref:Lipoprotein n=1 Tax=Leptospira wolffii TaxID=409998 RepID=A0ABV5BNY2_9LEPT|nr:hypothetical protein [Leptospira wolffii]EPG66103.1 hypothetical protein LEP1GSC061_2312 [Leptospira wolffii serovar Khorat str. Khorat-H2]TGL47586.1 hypothetical protein EHQ61_15900 [Leptospira wolffii]
MKRSLLIFGLPAFFLFFLECTREDTVPEGDANSQIYAAAQYLSNKCGDPLPSPFPVAIGDVQKRNLDLCSIAITKSECPFVGYPVACLLIYYDKPTGEIPWYLNFKDAFVTPKIP